MTKKNIWYGNANFLATTTTTSNTTTINNNNINTTTKIYQNFVTKFEIIQNCKKLKYLTFWLKKNNFWHLDLGMDVLEPLTRNKNRVIYDKQEFIHKLFILPQSPKEGRS